MIPTRSSPFATFLAVASVAVAAACSSSSSQGFPATDAGGDSPATTDGTTPTDAANDATGDASNADATSESGMDAGTGDAGDGATLDAGPPTVVLLSDAPNAWLIATDGTRVYWIDWTTGDAGDQNGRVMSVGVDGGTETTLASTPGVIPEGLALDSDQVYWTESDGKLWQVPKAGGAPVALVPTGVASQLTAAGGVVYFCPPAGGGVQSIPVDGGAVATLATSGNPVDLAIAGTGVYWADSTGHIASVPTTPGPDGGTPVTLVPADAGAGQYVSATIYQNLATDGTSLYWPRSPGSASGAVMTLPLDGGPPAVLVDLGTDSPQSVATDGTRVYFLDVGATSALAWAPLDPVDGGTPTTITAANMGSANVSGTPGPTIAVDSTSVYWLDPPKIVKVAK